LTPVLGRFLVVAALALPLAELLFLAVRWDFVVVALLGVATGIPPCVGYSSWLPDAMRAVTRARPPTGKVRAVPIAFGGSSPPGSNLVDERDVSNTAKRRLRHGVRGIFVDTKL
jgi:hypothetical protein